MGKAPLHRGIRKLTVHRLDFRIEPSTAELRGSGALGSANEHLDHDRGSYTMTGTVLRRTRESEICGSHSGSLYTLLQGRA